MTLKKFWSVEYIDNEGEQVVKHVYMTDEESSMLITEFAKQGFSAIAHQLSADVSLKENATKEITAKADKTTPQLEGCSLRDDK
jgi:predicted restriction endonuclease